MNPFDGEIVVTRSSFSLMPKRPWYLEWPDRLWKRIRGKREAAGIPTSIDSVDKVSPP